MKFRIMLLTLGLNALCLQTVKAQEEEEQPLDTLVRHVAGIRSDLDVLKRIKVSGYIQAQYQVADSEGIRSYAGGDFGPGVDKRFMLRRARVKVQYDAPVNDKGWSTSQYVFQVDVTERGVTIKDMYAKLTDPWIGWFSLTAGMQNKPFGHEIVYSSSLRESPERGRMSQIIFPGERDLGAMISVQGPKTSNWNWLKLDAGLFNGTGGPSAGVNAADFDKFKDFLGHIAATKSNKAETMKWGVGASYYNGGYRIDTFNMYTLTTDSAGVKDFIVDESKSGVSPDLGSRHKAPREHYGVDAQYSVDWFPGITSLRAEYIWGTQSGTASSTATPGAAVNTDIYLRKFNGAYFYFIQNIGKSPFQAVVKYDWYDPETEVKGDEIGMAPKTPGLKKTSATDIKYSTWGFGLHYRWDSNVRITAYYDLVKNETSNNLAGYDKDIKDNVFTLRLQVRF